MGRWNGDEGGMGGGMHRRMELRGRNLTGGAFVTVLDRRVYENGHGHALTGIIDGHGYGWNGSRRYDCHFRLCSWFSCMHFTVWHGVVLGMRWSRRVIGTGWRCAGFIRKLYYSLFLAYCFQTSSASTVALLH